MSNALVSSCNIDYRSCVKGNLCFISSVVKSFQQLSWLFFIRHYVVKNESTCGVHCRVSFADSIEAADHKWDLHWLLRLKWYKSSMYIALTWSSGSDGTASHMTEIVQLRTVMIPVVVTNAMNDPHLMLESAFSSPYFFWRCESFSHSMQKHGWFFCTASIPNTAIRNKTLVYWI